MSRTLQDMVSEYDVVDQKIDDHNTQIEELKKTKRALAEAIRTAHGAGPHAINGKSLVVVTARGTTFLRAPLKPPVRKSKPEGTPAPEDLPSE